MKILAIEKEGPNAGRPSAAALLREEAAAVYGLQQSGVVRETWFRADRDEAVLALECADEAEARSVLASLPLVRAGIIAFETIPLRPYPGFGRLFEGEAALTTRLRPSAGPARRPRPRRSLPGAA